MSPPHACDTLSTSITEINKVANKQQQKKKKAEIL